MSIKTEPAGDGITRDVAITCDDGTSKKCRHTFGGFQIRFTSTAGDANDVVHQAGKNGWQRVKRGTMMVDVCPECHMAPTGDA
jgi:hypothetical protein